MKTFKQYITEAPIPPEWDQEVFTPKTSFAKQLKYAIERSKKIGTGSSRVAFEIEYQGRPTILKIAKNKKGLAQNSKEADYGLYRMYPDITIPLIDYDEKNDEPLWIHFEKADKMNAPMFKKLTGHSFEDFSAAIRNDERRRNGQPEMYSISPEVKQQFDNEDGFFYNVVDLMGNFDLLAGDLTRLANWGVYKNKAVIIDLGFRSDVMKQHYS
jgi:hypothetical protein